MKKNTMMRIASVLLIAVLMTTCVISGTFAKYASDASVVSTGTIAKWSFDVNETDIATEDLTFNLFDTIFDSNGTDVEGDTSNKIAPGTKGSFDIVLKNTSEVTAKFKIGLTCSNDDIAGLLDFSATMKNDTDPAKFALNTFVTIASGATETVTVTWEWPFDENDGGNDGVDTGFGVDPATFTVTANIRAEQVD